MAWRNKNTAIRDKIANGKFSNKNKTAKDKFSNKNKTAKDKSNIKNDFVKTTNSKTTKNKQNIKDEIGKITIIAVVGLHSSGKSKIAEYIAKNYGFYRLETGDVVREFAIEKKGVADEKTLPEASEYLYKTYKDKYLMNKLVEKIEKQSKQGIKKFVVSGIKTRYAYKILNKLLGTFKQISVVLDADIRYKRAKERNRPDDEGADSRAQFNKRTWRELNQGVGNVLAISDFFIDNSSTLENAHKQADKIMSKFKITPAK